MKKVLLSIFVSFLLSACSGVFTQKQVQVNENLPRIANLKHISDMTSIAFEWDNVSSQAIDGFYLYRSAPGESAMKKIATINDSLATHYVDKGLEPDTSYVYMMQSFSKQGFISLDGAHIEARTLPRPEALPFVQASQNLAGAIKIIWRPHPDTRIKSYIVQRNSGRNGAFEEIAEVQGRLNAEYIDTKLKPEQSFSYRVYAKTYDNVYSKPSEIVSSTTKPLPPGAQNVSASIDRAGKIVLSWDEVNFTDLAYYKIYSSSATLIPYTTLAKTRSTSYEDIITEPGKKKRYKVTVVDKDGLESAMPRNGVEGMSLGRPGAPVINLTAVQNGAVELGWVDTDARARTYIVKRYGGGSDAIFKDITQRSLTDNTATQGVNYRYEVISVDENGIESEPSKRVKIGN